MHGQRDELHLRIRTAHTVAVHHRDSKLPGDEERDHRVDATDLDGHDCLHPPVQKAVDGLVRLNHLLAERKLLDQRHWRANYERIDDQCLIVQLVGGHETHRTVTRQRLQ